MFENDVERIRMRSISPLAFDFWKNRYKPIMDRMKRKMTSTPLTIGIWVPRLAGMVRLQLYEIVNDLENINITAKLCINETHEAKKSNSLNAMNGLETLCTGIENNKMEDAAGAEDSAGQAPEIIFGILLGQAFDLELFSNISPEVASKLFIFFNASIENTYKKENPDFRFKNIYPRSMPITYPDDFKSRKFIPHFIKCVDALRRCKYLQSLIPDTDRPQISKKSIFSYYEDYKCRIDIFQSSGHHYFISFIRFLSNPTADLLDQHLDVSIPTAAFCRYFQKNHFIDINEKGEMELTYSGDKYFKMLDLESLPILKKEKHRFRERWKAALERAWYTRYELQNYSNELARLSDRMYNSLAKNLAVTRLLRYTVNRFVCDWMTKEEKAFWAHPWTQTMFRIWRDNIAGLKRVWRSSARDRTAFLEYMYQKFRIHHHPNNADIFVNYKNLAFQHTMIRPNSHAHFYVIFSFEFRPIKKMIHQYFDLAAITGQYDLLFRRFYPYHFMLKLHSKPGERTSFDMRNYLDWKPLTFKMDTKITVPLTLEDIRTRQRDRSVSIPIKRDEEAENQKKAEIAGIEKRLGDIDRNLFIHCDFGKDGKIYTTDEKNPQEIDDFIGKRSRFIQMSDELSLLKAMPRPSGQSGLIVRFNLLDPISVLINGINRNRDLFLDEMRHLSKCLDLLSKKKIPASQLIEEDGGKGGGEEGKKKVRKKAIDAALEAIIDEVFESPLPEGLSEDTHDLVDALERIEKAEQSEEQAWAYLTSRFIHGKSHALLHTICHRLGDDGFEVLFSLYPLLTGKELKIDEKKEPVETQMAAFEENQVPLIENLKRELSDLLKDIFTRCIDISGATKRIQSEARLARMVVEHCLDVKSSEALFEKNLRSHLQNHYDAHLHFLKEHLGSSELFRYIHKIGMEVKDMIEADLAEIIRLTRSFQKRLFSRANNNRLLCFVDPDSVEVQIGEFEYGGEAINNELSYIKKEEERQRSLAEKRQVHEAEIREREMEKHTAIEKGKHEKEQEEARINKEKAIRDMLLQDEEDKIRAEEKKEAQMAQSRMKINQYKLVQVQGEARYLAADALKQGDMKTYAILSLLEAHQGINGVKGMPGVEKLLEESPNLLLTIEPDILEARHVHKLKETLLEKLDTVLDKLDPITLSTLFSKDYDELIRSDYYKSIVKVMSDTLKHMGYRKRPVVEQVFEEAKKGRR